VVYLREVARVELAWAGLRSVHHQDREFRPPPSSSTSCRGPTSLDFVVPPGEESAGHSQRGFAPQGLKYDIPFDTTKFVESAVHEVYPDHSSRPAGFGPHSVILVFLTALPRAVLVPMTTGARVQP